MYHTKIVKAALDSPDGFEPGISGVVLDDDHTILLASDHEDLNPSVTKDQLDEFASDYQTVASHPKSGKVQAEIRGRDGAVKDSHGK